MKFFKPEDFVQVTLEGTPIPNNLETFRERLAQVGNAKLNREGEVVYGKNSGRSIVWYNEQEKRDTHQALLIAIKPIEKCTHPNDKVTDRYGDRGFEGYECECGVKVKVKRDGYEEAK